MSVTVRIVESTGVAYDLVLKFGQRAGQRAGHMACLTWV